MKLSIVSTIGLTVISGVLAVGNSWAKPEYVVPTGAKTCDQCHLDNFGSGYKSGVLQAAASPLGKMAGLTAYIKSLSTPVTPIITGANTKPVIHPVNAEWNVTVGESTLLIPIRVSDAEDDNVILQGSVPSGAVASAFKPDTQTNLPMTYLRWTPTASQAGKIYNVSVTVKETGTGRSLVSDAMNFKIRVWPARTVASKNVSQFLVQQAQWNNNQLLLAGRVLFNSTVTTSQRSALLANLALNIKSDTNIAIGTPLKLTADTFGNWTQIINLNSSQVPCNAKVDYEGLINQRTVKLAPSTSCIK